MKKLLLGLVIGILISCGIVCAANYTAKEISYSRDNENMNVEDALDDLYNKKDSIVDKGSISITTSKVYTNIGFEPTTLMIYGNRNSDSLPVYIFYHKDENGIIYKTWNVSTINGNSVPNGALDRIIIDNTGFTIYSEDNANQIPNATYIAYKK